MKENTFLNKILIIKLPKQNEKTAESNIIMKVSNNNNFLSCLVEKP